jgi:adenosine kinase
MVNNKGKILVCGSVVIDIISKKKFYGGTGGNIAYGLAQLKSHPLLFSLVGKDFKKDYGNHLKKIGVDLQVGINKKEKTASFSYSIHEKGSSNEIWSPNAYKDIHKLSILDTVDNKKLKNITLAIFSPGSPESTFKHIDEFKKITPNATVIFDPGQMIHLYSKKNFIDCMNLSDILILNNSEYNKISKIIGTDLVKFFKNLKKVIIKTDGENGSDIYKDNRVMHIDSIKPKKVLDTMGAGDAYRAGMLYSLANNQTIYNACKFGSKLASINVEFIGCQSYKIPKQFLK